MNRAAFHKIEWQLLALLWAAAFVLEAGPGTNAWGFDITEIHVMTGSKVCGDTRDYEVWVSRFDDPGYRYLGRVRAGVWTGAPYGLMSLQRSSETMSRTFSFFGGSAARTADWRTQTSAAAR